MDVFISLAKDFGVPMSMVICMGVAFWKMYEQTRADNKEQLEIIRNDNKEREERCYEQNARFGRSLDAFNITIEKINNKIDNQDKVIEKVDLKVGSVKDELVNVNHRLDKIEDKIQ